MPPQPLPIGAGRVVRAIFGTATVGFTLIGLLLARDPRWLAAAAAFGAVWWAWDLLVAHVFAPLEAWTTRTLAGDGLGPPPNVRPTLDETIQLLERHLERPTTRQVDINAAIRLEEIYRAIKRDPAKARRVIRTVRERYPDAPELQRYD